MRSIGVGDGFGQQNYKKERYMSLKILIFVPHFLKRARRLRVDGTKNLPYMLRKIISIAGRPGLYRLVSQGKNMLIVESLADGRRSPAYAHDKVISLGDISMYTEGDDVALADVLESLKAKADGKPVDIKALGGEKGLREFFGEVLPDYDRERVYTADIKKLLQWYNALTAAGITEFKAPAAETSAADEASAADTADTAEA